MNEYVYGVVFNYKIMASIFPEPQFSVPKLKTFCCGLVNADNKADAQKYVEEFYGLVLKKWIDDGSIGNIKVEIYDKDYTINNNEKVMQIMTYNIKIPPQYYHSLCDSDNNHKYNDARSLWSEYE